MNDVVGHTEADIDIVQDVVYENKSGLSLTLDILQPSKRNRAAVIFFNSGGFYSPIFVRKQAADASSRWMLFQETQENKIYDLGLKFSFTELLSAGFTVFDIRHRSGPQYRLDEIVDDSRRAVEFIKINAMKYDIDANCIGAWGMSAGGYLAALAGTSPPEGKNPTEALNKMSSQVTAVVAYCPTGFDWSSEAALSEALPALKIDQATLDSLSLQNRISDQVAPSLIIYGDRDSGFITDQSDALYLALQKMGVESKLIVIPETGHLFLDEDDQYDAQAGEYAMSELLHWFQSHLVK